MEAKAKKLEEAKRKLLQKDRGAWSFVAPQCAQARWPPALKLPTSATNWNLDEISTLHHPSTFNPKTDYPVKTTVRPAGGREGGWWQ